MGIVTSNYNDHLVECCQHYSVLFVLLQSNHKLYLQLVDVEYQKSTVDEQAMLKLFGRAIDGPLPTEHRVAFSQRRLEFLEDFGSNVTR